MRQLYNFFIFIYYLAIRVFAVFNTKARKWVNGRRHFFSRLKKTIPEKEKLLWFHCASLGEFEQGRPVMEALRVLYPDHKILLTFFSPSGYEIRKNYQGADYVFYLPIDTKRNARKFVRIDLVSHFDGLHKTGFDHFPVVGYGIIKSECLQWGLAYFIAVSHDR